LSLSDGATCAIVTGCQGLDRYACTIDMIHAGLKKKGELWENWLIQITASNNKQLMARFFDH
jgi:hypothetical protein